MSTSNELEIVKVLEENDWNVKDMADRIVELQKLVDQLVEKNKQLEEKQNDEDTREQK